MFLFIQPHIQSANFKETERRENMCVEIPTNLNFTTISFDLMVKSFPNVIDETFLSA